MRCSERAVLDEDDEITVALIHRASRIHLLLATRYEHFVSMDCESLLIEDS